MHRPPVRFLALLLSVATEPLASAASGPAGPPDYLDLVQGYAEAMIRDGRDTCGREHSPLFAAALDRRTMNNTP